MGLDVQPPSDQLNILFTDTFSVEAITMLEDSVRTDKTSYYLLGSLNDPIFGFSEAGFCTQINIPSSSITFPDNITVDSMVLALLPKNYYGNDKYVNPMTIRVYEVADMLSVDSVYYSNDQIQKEGLIGSTTCIPNLKDSVWVNGSKLPPHVRVPLDINLAKRFIEDASYGFLSNNTTFTDYFRGIYVETLPFSSGGTIYYFDLMSTYSNITLYYHTPTDTAEFTFLINEKCARFNLFENDYTSATPDLINQLATPSTGGSDKLYVQSRGGIKVDISFPTIKNLIDPYPVIINKAELIFSIDETDITSSIYPIPAKLTLIQYKEDGSYTFLPDQTDATFGGSYDSSSKEYHFIISRHIQNLLKDGYEDYGITLIISGASTRGDRVVLNGMNHPFKKPRLKISYTIVN